MKRILFLAVAVVFIMSCASGGKKVSMKTPKEPHYTTVNIWYEKLNKIYSTNYHRGSILPAGTKVTILKIDNKGIDFQTEKDNLKGRIVYIKKHTVVPIDKMFKNLFSKTNTITAKKFTTKELTQIEQVNQNRD